MNLAVCLVGTLIIADAVGSIMLPRNNHAFGYEFERLLRETLGVLLFAYGFML